MTEFNLSEKIGFWKTEEGFQESILAYDVREFIRLLKEGYEKCFNEGLIYPHASENASKIIQNFIDFKEEIDKLAGDNLI